MNLFEKSWIERQEHSNSFAFEFSIPVSNLTWMDRVIAFDLEFLIKAEKFGLFYFVENVFNDYEGRRRGLVSKIIDNYIELLSLRNYFSDDLKSAYKYIGESYINLPFKFDGRMICKPMKYHQPFINMGILEFENFPGIDLNKFEKNERWEGVLYFTIYSTSNIWWEEILYSESEKGEIYKLELPKNNRPWSYRITPRFNSFLRDLKLTTIQLGGSILLEEFNKKYVTEEGILLDGRIIYQEDLDEGRIDLHSIDNYPA